MSSFVRRILELALAPFVFTRRLPPASGGGLIHVSTQVGGLKFALKSSADWDPELLKVASLLVKAGAVVWDVGANVGLFARSAAFHAGSDGSVLCIEADLDAARLLYATSRCCSGPSASLVVFPVAVSDEVGVARFTIARRARAANALEGFGSSQMGGVSETRAMPVTTLDSLLSFFPPPDVLKIDVEGAELRVLAGAVALLRTVRPKVYCEVGSGTRDEVVAVLKQFGYRICDGLGYGGERGEKAVGPTTTNIVAVPETTDSLFDVTEAEST